MNSTVLAPSHGYHTTSTTTLAVPFLPKDCSLHLHYTLPPLVFPDPYELDHYAHHYTFTYDGIRNLELPVIAVDESRNGSLLLDVAVPAGSGRVEVRVPLHLRYGQVAKHGGHITQEIPHPLAFTACQSHEPNRLSDLPMSLPQHLRGRLLTLIPLMTNGSHSVTIPVGRADDILLVEVGTAVTVLLGAFYLLRAFWATANRLKEKPVFKNK